MVARRGMEFAGMIWSRVMEYMGDWELESLTEEDTPLPSLFLSYGVRTVLCFSLSLQTDLTVSLHTVP